MATIGDIESAGVEWDYTVVEGSFGQDFDTSTPCQLKFIKATDQDTELFHEALRRRDFSPLDLNPTIEGKSPHYEGEVMLQETYNRIKVLVFRNGVIRLYPHDDYVPENDRLKDLIEAIEEGFGGEVEHSPIASKSEGSDGSH